MQSGQYKASIIWSRANHFTVRTLSFLFCKLIAWVRRVCSLLPLHIHRQKVRKEMLRKLSSRSSRYYSGASKGHQRPRCKNMITKNKPGGSEGTLSGGLNFLPRSVTVLSLLSLQGEQHLLSGWWPWINEQQQSLNRELCVGSSFLG